MACTYNILINGEPLEGISLPASSALKPEDLNLESFFDDLIKNKQIAQALVAKLKLVELLEKAEITPLSKVDKEAAFIEVQKHLANIGVPTHLLTNLLMQEVGENDENNNFIKAFPNNTTAGIYKGEIYINLDAADITSPMHEFMHLVFAVMRTLHPGVFKKIISLVKDKKEFLDIAANLPSDYSNYLELDRQEEIFIRLLEKIMVNESISPDIFEEDYDYINDAITLSIASTFGLPKIVNLFDFLKTPFSHLTKEKSELFIKKDKHTLGYTDKLKLVNYRALIMNLISDLITNGQILKGPCE